MAVEDEQTFVMHSTLLQMINADPTMVLDVLQTFDDVEQSENCSLDVCEKKPLPKRAPKKSNADAQAIEAPFLFYSRNLNASILSIEQSNGSIRQYRQDRHSTTATQKRAQYFRCSRSIHSAQAFIYEQKLFNFRCDNLNRNNRESGTFRPKITLQNGRITNNLFPVHHIRSAVLK